MLREGKPIEASTREITDFHSKKLTASYKCYVRIILTTKQK